MKKKYPFLLIIFLWMVFFAHPLPAETIYVTGVTKITMRTGPGVENKIIAMLKSGTKLEIVEYKRDWSQVQTDSGKTGWVLTRFLTSKVPDAFLIEKLKKEKQKLISRLEAIEQENKKLGNKNKILIQIETKYNQLKKKSAGFLKLDSKYKKIKEQYEAQANKIKSLKDNLDTEKKLWFISGAGIFVVGILLGLSTRKKKKSSLL